MRRTSTPCFNIDDPRGTRPLASRGGRRILACRPDTPNEDARPGTRGEPCPIALGVSPRRGTSEEVSRGSSSLLTRRLNHVHEAIDKASPWGGDRLARRARAPCEARGLSSRCTFPILTRRVRGYREDNKPSSFHGLARGAAVESLCLEDLQRLSPLYRVRPVRSGCGTQPASLPEPLWSRGHPLHR